MGNMTTIVYATVRWADGRITRQSIPASANRAFKFEVDGRFHMFSPTGELDENGIDIWTEDPPADEVV